MFPCHLYSGPLHPPLRRCVQGCRKSALNYREITDFESLGSTRGIPSHARSHQLRDGRARTRTLQSRPWQGLRDALRGCDYCPTTCVVKMFLHFFREILFASSHFSKNVGKFGCSEKKKSAKRKNLPATMQEFDQG